MKNTHKCPKCGSEKVGYLENLPDISDMSPKTQSIGWTPPEGAGKFYYPNYHAISAYVCTSCGFLEYYVPNVSAIQFDKMENYKALN